MNMIEKMGYLYFLRAMILRAKASHINCAFTLKDVEVFAAAIELPPSSMHQPCVGRFDHSKGYEWDEALGRWNFRWQEFSENSSENAKSQLANGTHTSQIHKDKVFGWNKLSKEERSKKSALAGARNSLEHFRRIGKMGAEKRWGVKHASHQ